MCKRKILKLHRISKKKKHSRLAVCITATKLSVVSDSEVMVMFVTLDGENPVRNISEWQEKCKYGGLEKKMKEKTNHTSLYILHT